MLAKVLGLLTSGVRPAEGAFVMQTSDQVAAHCAALLEASRERLRHAHRARNLARRELADAQAATERVREIMRLADVAAQEALDAESREREAARAWAASGALGERPVELRTLANVSRAAQRRADDAKVAADGAREALPGLLRTEEDAKGQLETAESALRTAVGGTLEALVEPEFARLERLALETEQTAARIQGLAKAAFHASSPISRCSVICGDILARLRQVMPGGIARDGKELWYERPEIDRDEWTELGKRLLEDPEARF